MAERLRQISGEKAPKGSEKLKAQILCLWKNICLFLSLIHNTKGHTQFDWSLLLNIM